MRLILGTGLTLGIAALTSCVSLQKINYPSGLLVTQSQWDPSMNSTLDNKPTGMVRYHSFSFLMPQSVEDGLKETLKRAEGKTLTSVRIEPWSWFVFHSLDISGEVSKR